MGDDDRAQPFSSSILRPSLLCAWISFTLIDDYWGMRWLNVNIRVLTIATIFFSALPQAPARRSRGFLIYLPTLKLNGLVKYAWPDDPFMSRACLLTEKIKIALLLKCFITKHFNRYTITFRPTIEFPTSKYFLDSFLAKQVFSNAQLFDRQQFNNLLITIVLQCLDFGFRENKNVEEMERKIMQKMSLTRLWWDFSYFFRYISRCFGRGLPMAQQEQ